MMKLIINKHRRDETAVIDEHARVTWEFSDGRYIELYQDEHGQIMVAADDAIAVQLQASNRLVLVPIALNGKTVTERLGWSKDGAA